MIKEFFIGAGVAVILIFLGWVYTRINFLVINKEGINGKKVDWILNYADWVRRKR